MAEREHQKTIKWKLISLTASLSTAVGLVSGKDKSSESELPPTPVPVFSIAKDEIEHQDYKLPLPGKDLLIQNQQEEQKKNDSLTEVEGVIRRLYSHPDIFGQEKLDQYVEDLKMYYPIYKVAADYYQLPWYLLWIIHEAESDASRNEAAFLPNATHYGAMQRSRIYHPDEVVNKISSRFSLLAFLPQRHWDDWREIVWAAAKISEDMEKTGSLNLALYRYSSTEQAQVRWSKYLKYSEVFGK